MGCTLEPKYKIPVPPSMGQSVPSDRKEVRKMDRKLEYIPRDDVDDIAQNIIDFLRPKELPIWQVKEALSAAAKLAEWEALKW